MKTGIKKESRIVRKIAVGDLETDPFAPGRIEINPFCCGYSDGKYTRIWWGETCVRDFVEYTKKLGSTIIYFHNGGNFDFHFMLEFLPVAECEFMCLGKRIVQLKLPWGVELRDSYAIIPKKLAAYEKEEIDYAKFEKEVREKHKEEIVKYLKSDLDNLLNMVNGFIKRFPNELTLASSVFKLMKKEYEYDPGRSSEAYDEKFRPFFFGGRVEFWELGEVKGKLFVVDINSAYPYAMTKKHWFGFRGRCSSEMPKKNMEQCLFVVKCDSEGALPYREKNGSITFPKRNDTYHATGWELKTGIELKLIKNLEIILCFEPEEVADIRKFSETLYGKKLAAKLADDKEEEFFNKIAVNAGYGKLALNPTKFKEVKVTELYEIPDRWKDKTDKKENPEKPEWENLWDDKDRNLSFWARSSYKKGIDKFINVATAASITGYVRAMLLRAAKENGGAVYCDTDSLILRNIKKIPLSNNLGDWKLEMTIDDSIKKGVRKAVENNSGLWIAGKKLYAAYGMDEKGKWKFKIASKGVKLSPERIISVAKGGTETMVFDAPTYSLFSRPKFVTREIRRADAPKIKTKKRKR